MDQGKFAASNKGIIQRCFGAPVADGEHFHRLAYLNLQLRNDQRPFMTLAAKIIRPLVQVVAEIAILFFAIMRGIMGIRIEPGGFFSHDLITSMA